jgi:hypothetical protein
VAEGLPVASDITIDRNCGIGWLSAHESKLLKEFGFVFEYLFSAHILVLHA